MEILGYVLSFVILSLFVAVSLWIAMKITKVDGTFLAMLIIAAVTILIGFIPSFGWILSLIALYFMLHKWTTAEFWPDAVILVAVAGVIKFVITLILGFLLVALGMAGALA